MTLHWWMHWFWVTVISSPALVSLAFFSSLAASPQDILGQNNVPTLFPSDQGSQHIRRSAGLLGKLKSSLLLPTVQVTSLPHRYQDGHFGLTAASYKNSEEEHLNGQKIFASNKHMWILHFILSLSKNSSTPYQTCFKKFISNVGYSETESWETLLRNLRTVSKKVSATSISFPQLWQYLKNKNVTLLNHVFTVLEDKDEISDRNFADKDHQPLQNLRINFDSKSSNDSVPVSDKHLFVGAISSYCVNVLKNTFTPLGAKDHDNIESQNKILSLRKFDPHVRRKKSVNLQLPFLKPKPKNEFIVKSSAVYSKVFTGLLTESSSDVSPTNVQKDSDLKNDIFYGNKVMTWFDALVKTFNNSGENSSQMQTEYLNNVNHTNDPKHIPGLFGSLSLVFDITGHKATENSSNNTTHQIKSMAEMSGPSGVLSSAHNMSENMSTNVSTNHSNDSVKSDQTIPTNVPSTFVPVTHNDSPLKIDLGFPTIHTTFTSKPFEGEDGNVDAGFLSESVTVSPTASTDFPDFVSTFATVQHGTDYVQSSKFPSGVEEISETESVTSGIPITKEEMVIPGVINGSEKSSKAALITGIVLGVVIFGGISGTVLFVLYRRHFLNKPQSFNDKCSNPDSSGYIDDSTLRENSEEMYSLDNDSFLNSLEAMTIQNYWTENVKHTKL